MHDTARLVVPPLGLRRQEGVAAELAEIRREAERIAAGYYEPPMPGTTFESLVRAIERDLIAQRRAGG